MECEINFIKEERKLLQEYYWQETKEIWTKFEGIEADKKHKKAYNKYKHLDKFLELLEAKIDSNLAELEYYKKNMRG